LINYQIKHAPNYHASVVISIWFKVAQGFKDGGDSIEQKMEERLQKVALVLSTSSSSALESLDCGGHY
jgi:hypothetical protein